MTELSFKYRFLKSIIKASGFKKIFAKQEEELLAMARKKKAKVRIPKLSHPDVIYEIKDFEGEKVVVIKHRVKSEKACLFLIGGGMIMSPRPAAIKKSMKIALATGRDMIIPYYPLCIDNTIDVSYDFIYKLYVRMLKEYDASNIIVTGSSSGGNLAIGLVAHINALGGKFPLPNKIYASSPGECFGREDVIERGKELNKEDFLIDVKYMESAESIMTKGKSVPEYMLYLERGDYHGLNEVYLCYSDTEVLYAAYEPISGRLKECGVNVIAEIGHDMYHVYPFAPIVKEAIAGWNNMIEYHK